MPIEHLALYVSDIEKSKQFYAASLKPLGYKLSMQFKTDEVDLVAFGQGFNPDFWLCQNDKVQVRAEETPRVHFAFKASCRSQVRAWYKASLAAGGKDNGPPGLRPQYFFCYFAAFIKDPDGNNIEAVTKLPGALNVLAEIGFIKLLVGLTVAAGYAIYQYRQ